MTEYIREELLEMSDKDFQKAVCENLHASTRPRGPFQHPDVIRLTLSALLDRFWFADAQMKKQADDPNVDAEHYARTVGFRNHVLSCVDMTERRLSRMEPQGVAASMWKDLLHKVCDELAGQDEFDDILDEFTIPFGDITLRTWREIRQLKKPSRIPEWEKAA